MDNPQPATLQYYQKLIKKAVSRLFRKGGVEIGYIAKVSPAELGLRLSLAKFKKCKKEEFLAPKM